MSTKNKAVKATGIVEVRMVNPKRTGTLTLRSYTDPETGRIKEFKDANGNARVKRYKKALTILNLENEDDRLEYEMIKDHPVFVKCANPSLTVTDVVQEAEKRISRREVGYGAIAIVKELRGDKLVDFARVLGINTHNVLESIVKDKMYDIVDTKPEIIVEAWEDKDRVYKELLYRGKMRSVFTHNNNIWKYREATMGNNIDEAIYWLKQNEDLMPGIRKEISSTK